MSRNLFKKTKQFTMSQKSCYHKKWVNKVADLKTCTEYINSGTDKTSHYEAHGASFPGCEVRGTGRGVANPH